MILPWASSQASPAIHIECLQQLTNCCLGLNSPQHLLAARLACKTLSVMLQPQHASKLMRLSKSCC
jgi:hypothetical protein